MKQKFTLIKDKEQQKLIVKEYAELDKEILSLLCEEVYDTETVEAAIAKGNDTLIRTLRTKNMYPPSAYMDQIVEAVIALFKSESDESKELILNDMDVFLSPEAKEVAEVKEDLEDDGDIDDLLDGDEVDDDLDEQFEIKKLRSSLKIVDDESEDTDDE